MMVMMAAAAGIAVRMLMIVVVMLMSMVMFMLAMGVLVRMAVMVLMSVAVMVMSVVMVVIAHMGAALRLEGALHGRSGAALPPRQFGESRIVLDVEGIARHLHEAVLAAQVPGKTRQAEGVLGPYLQETLGRSLHLH